MWTPLGLCLIIAATHPQMPAERVLLACGASPVLEAAAQYHKVPPRLLAALVHVESRWDPLQISPTGDCGLTQVNPRWSTWSCDELRVAPIGLWAGAKLLGEAHRGRRSWRVALACYHTGPKCRRSGYEDTVLAVADNYDRTAKRIGVTTLLTRKLSSRTMR